MKTCLGFISTHCYFKDVYKIVAIYVNGLKLLFKNVKIKSVLMREVHSLTGSTREVNFNHYFPLIRLFPHKLRVDISRHRLASLAYEKCPPRAWWRQATREYSGLWGGSRWPSTDWLFLTQYLVVYSLTTTLTFTFNHSVLILDINEFAETLIAVETQLRQKIKEFDRQLLKTTNSFQVFLFLPNCTYPINGYLKRPFIHQLFPPKIIV